MNANFLHASAVALALCAFGAAAADARKPAEAGQGSRTNAQATYQADRAACLSGSSAQDRQTCLREAGAALAESRKGGLDDHGANYDQNRLARCDSQPIPEDRAMCIRMMNGEGTASGSVDGGGIYRELVIRQSGS